MTSQFSDMTSSSSSFNVVLFPLSRLFTGPSFNTITGSRVMTIFFSKGLARNPEIGNFVWKIVWGLPNIWRLELVRDTNFGKNVSNEMFLNTAKCQGFSFYRFWVIEGTVMKIEKALINNRLRALKVSNYLEFFSNSPVKFAIFLKNSLLLNIFYCLFCL